MAPFLTVDQLQERLPWTLDADERKDAAFALEFLSDLAREYGKSWYDAASAPSLVTNLVSAAAKRYLANTDGLIQSRAGDETLVMTDLGDKSGSPYFTDAEIKLLKSLSGKVGIISVPATAWRTRETDDIGYVPVAGGGDPFPYYSSSESPW